MILFPTIVMPPQPATAQDVLQRLDKFVQSAQSLSVDCKLTSSKEATPGAAHLVFVRPSNMLYSLKWGQIDYKFVGNGSGSIDLERVHKVYDVQPEWSTLASPRTELAADSGVPSVFPSYLITDPSSLASLKYGGQTNINGVAADELDATAGKVNLRLYVNSAGEPVRYHYDWTSQKQDGTVEKGSLQCDLSNYKVNLSPSQALFQFAVPTGYRELTLPLDDRPAGVGEKFPFDGWTGSGTSLADEVKQKDSLIVVTDQDCDPSAASASAVKQLADGGNLSVLVVSLSPTGAKPAGLDSYPTYYDPKGDVRRKANFPGTPMFYLVNKTGDIIKVWYGFDPDSAADFVKDVQAALKGG